MTHAPHPSRLSFLMRFFLAFLTLLGPALHAQPAGYSNTNPDPLPMRNLQIEVRQVRGGSQAQGMVGAQGGVLLQPGHSGATVNITAQSSQRSDARDLVQRVLVLNGRPVAINLGNTTPLRLTQAFVQNGVLRYVGSTVLIDTNSGFSARPVWRGGSSAELELAAMQSRPGTAGAVPSSSSASTSVALVLGEWVTVAQSDDAATANSSGVAGAGQTSGQEALTVEVRISVR
ncbi:hypothetical protein [Polaromonas sp. JS666]|uniref:hypothetical protein n=1 Tax=Polaromonas sp. (strain JS666 / ATCC BAA-500) TaxID=296591 RepID=UPI000053605F|nr:hypothetical protein [Polaromonas sp. JS666]ABE46532.1 hypothetical protein Bpro_4649 [Polaromonas sp. JS666]